MFRKHGPKAVAQAAPKHGEPEARPPDDEPHFCCICGAQLGFDLEDELNGEGLGNDICGDC